MLKTDFNGYVEFAKKVLETSNPLELKKLYIDRTQMWLDKLQNILSPIPAADAVFVITALRTTTKIMEEVHPEEAFEARRLEKSLGYELKTKTMNSDMSEAAMRALAEAVFKK